MSYECPFVARNFLVSLRDILGGFA